MFPRSVPLIAFTLLFSAPGASAPRRQETPKEAAANTNLARSKACWKRFEATCQAARRCMKSAADLGGERCQAVDPGCDRLFGPAPYSESALNECLAGLSKATCSKSMAAADPNDPDAWDLERLVPACRTLSAAEDRLARENARAQK